MAILSIVSERHWYIIHCYGPIVWEMFSLTRFLCIHFSLHQAGTQMGKRHETLNMGNVLWQVGQLFVLFLSVYLGFVWV